MSIDKQILQKLLWAEAASFRADCADWKRNTEALQEFLGEKTVEEMALELLAENERLRADLDGEISQARDFNIEHEELKSEVESLRTLTTLGVALEGDLRVYGDWQSVRAARELIWKIDQFKAERDQLKVENEALRDGANFRAIQSLRQDCDKLRTALVEIASEIDGNTRPLIRDLVNRASGLNNGTHPNDLYGDCDRIEAIIDAAMSKAVQP